MKPNRIIRTAHKLQRKFTRLNLEKPRKVRRLYRKVQQQHRRMKEALQALQQRKDDTKERLAKHDEPRPGLLEQEQELAAELKETTEPEQRFRLTRELRATQLDLSMLDRTKTDLELTLQQLRSWILNVDEAVGILRILEERLQYNVERLEIADLVNGEHEPEKKCEITGYTEAVRRGNAKCESHLFPRLAGGLQGNCLSSCPACARVLQVCGAIGCGHCGSQIQYRTWTKTDTAFAVAYKGDRDPTDSEVWTARKKAREARQPLVLPT